MQLDRSLEFRISEIRANSSSEEQLTAPPKGPKKKQPSIRESDSLVPHYLESWWSAMHVGGTPKP